MKEAKKIFLYLAGVALLIIAIGMFKNYSDGEPLVGNITIPSQNTSPSTTYRKIKVAETDLSVVIADTQEERKIGLSETSSLSDDEGMLFVFESQNTSPAFWMKDMEITIDIIFINDGKIVKIYKNVRPQPDTPDNELTLYRANEPVDYVLETASGWSDKNNIQVGDSVEL